MSCGYVIYVLRPSQLQMRNICYWREGLSLTSITDTVKVILKFIYLEDLSKTTGG